MTKTVFTCPVCNRVLDGPIENWPSFPFCRKKCRMIDMGRWLTGENNLPVMEPDVEIGEEEDS